MIKELLAAITTRKADERSFVENELAAMGRGDEQ